MVANKPDIVMVDLLEPRVNIVDITVPVCISV